MFLVCIFFFCICFQWWGLHILEHLQVQLCCNLFSSLWLLSVSCQAKNNCAEDEKEIVQLQEPLNELKKEAQAELDKVWDCSNDGDGFNSSFLTEFTDKSSCRIFCLNSLNDSDNDVKWQIEVFPAELEAIV